MPRGKKKSSGAPPVAMTILEQEVNISARAAAYLVEVERRTGRSLEVVPLSEAAILLGIGSRFKPDPEGLVIALADTLIRFGDNLEHVLCHEATHGLLIYHEGYRRLRAGEGAPEGTAGHLSLLMTMIDDLVVNRRLADAGIPAYPPAYIAAVKKTLAEKDKGSSTSRGLGAAYQAHFRAYQFVTAWGCASLWGAPLADRKVLARFRKQQSLSHPQEVETARRVITCLEQGDIFTAVGHLEVSREACEIWGLSGVEPVE